jgi:hypothetical protein
VIRAENIRVRVEAVEPEPIWIDFEDAHFRIYGTLAWFYRALTITESEASAQAKLRPWLMDAKKKSGVTSPEHAAPSLCRE